MKSVIAHLGTQSFPRLRIGIGSAKEAHPDKDAVSHVLGRFSEKEAQTMTEVLQLVVGAVEYSLKHGVEKAMSLYNSHNVVEAKE
jgi:PTH1 family peptidyl-tRNA hydrolase